MTVITRLNTDRPDSPHSKQTLHLSFFMGGVGLQTAYFLHECMLDVL